MQPETQPQRTTSEPSAAVEVTPLSSQPAVALESENELVVDDLLVEDVSIDGMCGVY